MKIKTSDLTGTALDWAVAYIMGATDAWRSDAPFFWNGVPCVRVAGHDVRYSPSTDWALGGPIIEGERIDIKCWEFHSMPWKASMRCDDENTSGDIQMHGPTPLIAAMRCYVVAKWNDEVEIPEELKCQD